MAGRFAGKVVIVTGGASGIGRATALAFGRDGASVVIADVDAAGGEQTVRSIKDAGGESTFVATDVSQASDVAALINRVVETYGRVDCAHNNAGVEGMGGPAAFHEYREETWDRLMSINLKGAWLCMKAEIAQMLQQGGGAIVNTSSVLGLVGGLSPAYTASKHGVVGLTKTAALEYAKQGIRVNAVCPGAIRTPMVERAFAHAPGLEQAFLAGEPVGRFGTPEEVAEAVLWLSSDAASFVTGVAFPVDGGWVAR